MDNFIQEFTVQIFLNERLAVSRAILCTTSDLAAMGALPYCVFIIHSGSKKKNKNFFKNLVKGIKDASNHVEVKIAGGDLTSYEDPLFKCIAAIGKSQSIENLKKKRESTRDYLAVIRFYRRRFYRIKSATRKK